MPYPLPSSEDRGPSPAVAVGSPPTVRRRPAHRDFLAGDPARGRSMDRHPIRVVVVDDNEGFRESLIALLTAAGHEVAGEAGDGWEALDVIADQRPDVVLM